ncbi:hypothetical protein B0H19DRAFT_1067126 [Mycena capillaripes]|nr:hypothetical protein B0H19DRAFT_1067126 [Mycena capillaripes]
MMQDTNAGDLAICVEGVQVEKLNATSISVVNSDSIPLFDSISRWISGTFVELVKIAPCCDDKGDESRANNDRSPPRNSDQNHFHDRGERPGLSYHNQHHLSLGHTELPALETQLETFNNLPTFSCWNVRRAGIPTETHHPENTCIGIVAVSLKRCGAALFIRRGETVGGAGASASQLETNGL